MPRLGWYVAGLFAGGSVYGGYQYYLFAEERQREAEKVVEAERLEAQKVRQTAMFLQRGKWPITNAEKQVFHATAATAQAFMLRGGQTPDDELSQSLKDIARSRCPSLTFRDEQITFFEQARCAAASVCYLISCRLLVWIATTISSFEAVSRMMGYQLAKFATGTLLDIDVRLEVEGDPIRERNSIPVVAAPRSWVEELAVVSALPQSTVHLWDCGNTNSLVTDASVLTLVHTTPSKDLGGVEAPLCYPIVPELPEMVMNSDRPLRVACISGLNDVVDLGGPYAEQQRDKLAKAQEKAQNLAARIHAATYQRHLLDEEKALYEAQSGDGSVAQQEQAPKEAQVRMPPEAKHVALPLSACWSNVFGGDCVAARDRGKKRSLIVKVLKVCDPQEAAEVALEGQTPDVE